ncbi:NADPH oxidoreductase, putative flavodoxin quinone reductase FqrB [Campylobacter vicugnae]|uniref:NADPH oxidoreductase, putative flavodoxin quinone reductase FqrB n=2 Tax=Campylobacter vicugnae TaxID=1660076 RepID=A0A1X9T0Q7_9BACT|nr:NAD(P)-binding domain-containing protein [Campylobacter sp. RM8964]ARR02033.1 NADPH oxidoreductase, putative flavodoxin quinone reductase FqrB [Campylobacter sp. RM8964]
MENLYDVVVIGGGPFGIASVVEAKKAGFANVLLLEKGDNHSQTIRKFYKDGKRVDKVYKGLDSETKGCVEFFDGTKESTLNYFDKLLDDGDIEAIFNAEVESVKKDGDLLVVTTAKGVYKAKNVMVGIGRMGKPNKPDYKIPPSLIQVVNYNLNNCNCGEKIIVVGGGNSAAEYAVDLSGCNDVTLNYRRSTFTRLNDINLAAVEDSARDGKLTLKLGVDIVGIENDNGKVSVSYGDGSVVIYDRIIYAIGGSTPVDFLQKCGIELDSDTKPIVDENLQTNVKGLYVGGDIASKNGASIVSALNDAHKIMNYIVNNKA